MKILVIAAYSPIINNSAAIESLSYLNALCDLGYEVHVLTVDFKKDSIYYDKNIESMLDKRVKMHKVSPGKIFERAVPKRNSTNGEKKKNKFKDIIRKTKNKIMIPDAYCFWINKAYKHYVKILRKEKFQVIFSMHEPPSSHLVALKIKKRDKIKWIAYFSDPWILDSSREEIGVFRRNFEKVMEKGVIKNADKYIFVTEENKNDFIRRYTINERDIEVLRRSYNNKIYDEIRKNLKRKANKEINIVYTGEIFTKLRDIIPFLQCIKKIKEENYDLYKRLRIYFYGNIDSTSIIEYMNTIDIIKLMPRISFKKAIEKILSADILLIFGNKGSKQIPAKIYDYLGENSPILGILGDENDPLKDICSKIEKCFVTNNNILDIEKQLYNIIKELDKGTIYEEHREYSYNNFMKKLHKIMEN